MAPEGDPALSGVLFMLIRIFAFAVRAVLKGRFPVRAETEERFPFASETERRPLRVHVKGHLSS